MVQVPLRILLQSAAKESHRWTSFVGSFATAQSGVCTLSAVACHMFHMQSDLIQKPENLMHASDAS